MVHRISEEIAVSCTSDRATVWSFVSDTDRMNREAGLAAHPRIRRLDGSGLARHRVTMKLGPFALEYDEEPFVWVEPVRHVVRRHVKSRQLRLIESVLRLEATPEGGTEVHIRASAELGWAMLEPIFRPALKRSLDRLGSAIRAFDAGGQGKKGDGGGLDPQAFARALARLGARGGGGRPVERLAELVRNGEDHAVSRIRPFVLADAWGTSRTETLALCLEAVVAGLLELRWELVCPSCRTASRHQDTLSELSAHARCELCDIDFELSLDRSVEASFRPASSVRRVRELRFCTGGPAATPHVTAQDNLHPGRVTELPVSERAGRYRLFIRGGETAVVDVEPGGPARAEVRCASCLEPRSITVAPGGVLAIDYQGDAEVHAKLERLEWKSLAATAHHVSMLPEFRSLFSSEVLTPGLALSVSRVTLLFTDLSGSTRMYTRIGDARAFRLVEDHFALLRKVVAEHEGSVVKTIGDAVMAAFPEERAAVRAAVAMQRAFAGFREGRAESADGVHLKIGVHAGPSYVVTANGLLDYFGQTVNLAARLQGQAGEAEVVMSEPLASRAEEVGWLDGVSILERFDAELKGIDGAIRAARLRP